MFEEYPTISESKAQELVETGEWTVGSVVHKAVSEEASKKLDSLRSEGALDAEVLVASTEAMMNAFNAAEEALPERFSCRSIRHREDRSEMMGAYIRVKEHVVFKIVPTLHEGLFKILGIVVALLATTNITDTLSFLRVGLAVREFVKVIVSGWERLTDSAEQIVFEAVFTLYGKLTVVNYAALDKEDFETAYGNLWPLEEDIVSYCRMSLQPDQTRKTLEALRKRRVLGTKNGRWHIEF